MILQTRNKQRKYKTELFIPLIENAIEITLSDEKISDFLGTNNIEPVLSLIFVSKNEIKKLNSAYRNVNHVTDVLSFPQIDDNKMITKVSDKDIFINETGHKELLLGDIVICPGKADEQAAQIGHSINREIVFLTVHSVLHLLGYDHITEKDEVKMTKKQKDIMNKIVRNQ